MTRGTSGWVYVLRSEPHPHVCKIGRSSHNADRRAREIAGEPGYEAFAPFEAIWALAVPDMERVELGVHRMLHHRRLRRGRGAARELFVVTPSEARAVVEAVAASASAAASPLPSPLVRRATTRRSRGRPSRPLRLALAAAALAILFAWPPAGRFVVGNLVHLERQVVAHLP